MSQHRDSTPEFTEDDSRWRNPQTLRTLATILLVIALSFWLLEKLAVVLRPLLLAVLIAYVLLPYHNRLRKVMPAAASVVILGVVVVILFSVVGLVVVANLADLESDLPKLQSQAIETVNKASHWVAGNAPWLKGTFSDVRPHAGGAMPERIQQILRTMLGSLAGGLLEVMTAGLYLLFLLLGAGQLNSRVRGAYDTARAERIMDVAGRINSAIISYLKAKVQSSFLLATAAGIILGTCGVQYAFLWAVLTFLCNFIPYIGSVIGYGVPIAFAAFSSNLDVWFFVTAGLLLSVHVLSATVVEPMILGKAVGLSPLVILAALALWGSLWGFTGMFMAVPLTVVVVIVLEHFEASRPVARLLTEK
jgi:AI-2 transport protein TqsA